LLALERQNADADAGRDQGLDRLGVAELHDRAQLDARGPKPALDELVGLAAALAQDEAAPGKILRNGTRRQLALLTGEEGHHGIFAERLDFERRMRLYGHGNHTDIE